MQIRHINKKSSGKNRFVAPLFRDATGDDEKKELLWGDRVQVLDDSEPRTKVKARGVEGFVTKNRLSSTSLLELYFIDVGQGDGVLIRTPDHRHIMIDGGWPRKSQPTGKNAADFVDWKFVKDYGGDTILIDAMICSHNDQDHYGGLWNLLDAADIGELDADHVRVEQFYHAGLSWWKKSGGGRTLGPSATTTQGDMWTRLLSDRASIVDGLKTSGSQPKLQGEWADFLRAVRDAVRSNGTSTPVQRLDSATGSLPGFTTSDLDIQVLAPVAFEVAGNPAIRKFGSKESINTNGNSVLLRLDYKKVRVLLTGDLNTKIQQSLLADYAGETGEFAADVAKACHHGSGDVSLKFLETIEPACTVISSGDSEGHDHPKPQIVAASGITGHRTVDGDRLLTPLVYSTELARSVPLGTVTKIEELSPNTGNVTETFHANELENLRTRYEVILSGDRNPRKRTSNLEERKIADKTTYGLINVRTDGETTCVPR